MRKEDFFALQDPQQTTEGHIFQEPTCPEIESIMSHLLEHAELSLNGELVYKNVVLGIVEEAEIRGISQWGEPESEGTLGWGITRILRNTTLGQEARASLVEIEGEMYFATHKGSFEIVRPAFFDDQYALLQGFRRVLTTYRTSEATVSSG